MATNLLPVNQDTFEDGGIDGYTTAACTIANSTTQALHGTHSLKMTATSGYAQVFSDVSSTAKKAPVSASTQYTGLASLYAATTGRGVICRIYWYDSSNAALGGVNGSLANTVVGSWVQCSVTATSPAGAAFAIISSYINGTAVNGEIWYIDCLSIAAGSSTTWTAAGVAALQITGTGAGTGTGTATPLSAAALTATGAGIGTGTATTADAEGSAGTGAGVGSGTASLLSADTLTTTGAGIGTGSASQLSADALGGSGAGVGGGTAAISNVLPITGSGAGIGSGSANLLSADALTTTGAGTGTGTATALSADALSTTGAGKGSGSAAISSALVLQLTGSGDGIGTGSAAIAVAFQLAGAGAGIGSGSAAVLVGTAAFDQRRGALILLLVTQGTVSPIRTGSVSNSEREGVLTQ